MGVLCAGIVAAAQRQAYLPSLSPGSTVSQASFSGYAGSRPVQPQAAAWGMLPMHSSAQSIWSSTPADRCSTAHCPLAQSSLRMSEGEEMSSRGHHLWVEQQIPGNNEIECWGVCSKRHSDTLIGMDLGSVADSRTR